LAIVLAPWLYRSRTALSQAREASRRIACASNLRQLALAVHSYAHDFDERLPAAWDSSVGGGNGWGTPGLGRMFSSAIGGQISWLIPSALILLAVGLFLRGRARRTDARRAAYVVWGGWLLVTMVTFSLMAGIFHEYYTVALAPAIGALVGLGCAVAWRERERYPAVVAVAACIAVFASALWTAYMLTTLAPGWIPWLAPVVVIGGIVAVVLIVGATILRRDDLGRVAVVTAVLVTVLTPMIASVATAAEPHTGAIPSAAPDSQGGFGGPRSFGSRRRFGNGVFAQGQPFQPPGQGFGGPPQFGARPFGGGGGGRSGGPGGLLDASNADPAVVQALQVDAIRYRWTAATTGSNNAAGLALASRTSVMSIGGFNGTDPAPTLEQFQAYVRQGLIHYYVGGSDAGGFRGAIGGSQDAAEIAAWVEANYEQTSIGGMTLYDLTAG